MSKIDFSKIVIKDINDKDCVVDIQKKLGNEMYMMGQHIVECEVGRKIYHATEPIELDKQEQQAVLGCLERSQYSFILRQEVEKTLKS